MKKNEKLQNLYNMLREFYYEKNGIESTIEFLTYMLEELKQFKDNK